jgi:hypothetical protein
VTDCGLALSAISSGGQDRLKLCQRSWGLGLGFGAVPGAKEDDKLCLPHSSPESHGDSLAKDVEASAAVLGRAGHLKGHLVHVSVARMPPKSLI